MAVTLKAAGVKVTVVTRSVVVSAKPVAVKTRVNQTRVNQTKATRVKEHASSRRRQERMATVAAHSAAALQGLDEWNRLNTLVATRGYRELSSLQKARLDALRVERGLAPAAVVLREFEAFH